MKFHLIPIARATKRPLTRNGEKNASNDPMQLAAWRRQFPDCNWAVCTGPSGLLALDEDLYKIAFTEGALEKAIDLPELPQTVEWKSARGGRIRIFLRPEGETITSRNGALPAIDVKASTGFVLCPPSKNAAGQAYEWVNRPSEVPIAAAPPELVQWLKDWKGLRARGAEKPRQVLGGVEQVFLRSGDGRWDFLRRLGGLLRKEGCGGFVIHAALSAFVREQCEYDDTVSPQEIDRMVAWLMTVPVGADARLEEEIIEENGKFIAVEKTEGKKEEA